MVSAEVPSHPSEGGEGRTWIMFRLFLEKTGPHTAVQNAYNEPKVNRIARFKKAMPGFQIEHIAMMACLECCGFIFKVLTFLLGSKAMIFSQTSNMNGAFGGCPRVAGVPGAVLRHAGVSMRKKRRDMRRGMTIF